MENKDLNLLITAVIINSQVGGNLTTMMEVVTQTIRERMRMFREVRVLTSQNRYTGYVLSLLPFILGGVLFLLNPSFMAHLFEPTVICIPIGVVINIILGNLWIRKLMNVNI